MLMEKDSQGDLLRPSELKTWLLQGKPHFLLDVREAGEWQIARIEGAIWIPMREIPARLAELPKDRPIVIYCHHGMRSASVQRYLLQNGFSQVFNLCGGINAWSEEIDPNVPTY